MKILLTGGAGYLGSHTAVELLSQGHEVSIFDNLSNSKIECLNHIEEITKKRPNFYEVDLLDKPSLDKLFKENNFDAVIHFAGLKAVGESVRKPLKYDENNIIGTLNLLDAMQKYHLKKLIFSSSATVYGDVKEFPIKEEAPTQEPSSPYGKTKLIIEYILKDIYVANPTWEITILRYFNPIGAHQSGKIGEDPNGIPNNLVPYIAQVAVGKLEKLTIFGNDFDTRDGYCIRDYIHVVDLAKGHIKALENLQSGVHIYNLGTGNGSSVFEVVKAFSKACGCDIPYIIGPRRTGDLAETYADPTKAQKELNWKATKTLDEMCEDSWRWQSNNPNGY